MQRFRHILVIILLSIATVHIHATTHERMIIPQWNVYNSDFRNASIDANGSLTDTYTREGCDTVNVIDTNISGKHTLSISVTISNLHNNPYKYYSCRTYNDKGQTKRGKSVQRPIYGWVIGLKDMLHYNAVLMRPSKGGYDLYSHSGMEMCIVTINDSDTIYHTQWQPYSSNNNNYNNGTHTIWMQYKNNTLMVGSGWDVDMPHVAAHNIELYGNKTGLYLDAGSKVCVEDAMIIIEEQESPTLTPWNSETLYQYFYYNTTSTVEGLWEIVLENRRKNGVKIGGEYKLAIVANGNNYDIIYLSGANIHPKQWREGMLKGRMTPYASGCYKVEWFDAEGDKMDNILAWCYGNDIKIEFIDENTMLYLTRSNEKEIIETSTGYGTGFALNSNGYIATNYHVVRNSKNIIICQMEGTDIVKAYKAQTIARDSINDIAILRINDDTFTTLGDIPYHISNREVRKGEKIFYMGYPVMEILSTEIKTSDGIITAIYGLNPSQYMVSIDIDHGSSGSPVFDIDGNIIGIVVSKIQDGSTSIEANFAIKIEKLFDLMSKVEGMNTIPTNKIKGLSHPDKIEAIAPYIYIILSEY